MLSILYMENVNAADNDRDRGILSQLDREFLEEPDEFDARRTWQRKKEINNRVENAVYDFNRLVSEYDEELLAEVFAPERHRETDEDGDEVVTGEIKTASSYLPYAVAFLIRASLAAKPGGYGPDVSVEASLSPFVRNVERGVEIWLNEQHNLTGDVSVSFNVENVESVDNLADELRERDDRVTGRERIEAISELSRAGYSTDEIVEILGDAEPNDEDTDEKVDMDDLTPEHAVVDEEEEEEEDDEPVGEDLDDLLREVLGSRVRVAVYVALREAEHDEPEDIAHATGLSADEAERVLEDLREDGIVDRVEGQYSTISTDELLRQTDENVRATPNE